MALRERFHLHDVVSPRSHKLGQHWERETLFILVRDWHFCYMDFSLFCRSNKSGLCLRITESRFRYIFCWSVPDEMGFFDFRTLLLCLLLLYTDCLLIFSQHVQYITVNYRTTGKKKQQAITNCTCGHIQRTENA